MVGDRHTNLVKGCPYSCMLRWEKQKERKQIKRRDNKFFIQEGLDEIITPEKKDREEWDDYLYSHELACEEGEITFYDWKYSFGTEKWSDLI